MNEVVRKVIRISVRDLVEFTMRQGDLVLDSTPSKSRLREAIKAHQRIQKSMPEKYQAEITVKKQIAFTKFELQISGRIDGLMLEKDEQYVEEIKTFQEENFPQKGKNTHWAQAKIYAFFICEEHQISTIKVRLTYCNLDTKEIQNIDQHFSFGELSQFFDKLVSIYTDWLQKIIIHQKIRNKSLNQLIFPFKKYRKGQRELAKKVFRTIRENKQIFLEAPTGLGKTAAVTFAACKSMLSFDIDKIFYLTARTTGKQAAENAMYLLKKSKLKTLTLTAKEKICFQEELSCNGEFCPYARKYYDKLPHALEDIFHEYFFTRETVERYARKHEVCPFEFSLEISLFVDMIIADYNYAFDPKVKLKRFFADEHIKKRKYIFLIDEAHQLVDRARNIFSTTFQKKWVTTLNRDLKQELPIIRKILRTINRLMLDKKRELQSDKMVIEDIPKNLIQQLHEFIKETEKYLPDLLGKLYFQSLLDFYFEVHDFIRVAEIIDDKYRIIIQKDDSNLIFNLFCLDPSTLLNNALSVCSSSIFFSATLTPFGYFHDVLGANHDCSFAQFLSPFPSENLKMLMIPRVSTRFRHRKTTLSKLIEYLAVFIDNQKGNTLLFFPSYAYMNMTLGEMNLFLKDKEIVIQKSNFTESERIEFINKFNEQNKQIIGFAVMGGVFGEGIDLHGEKLTSIAIIGTGLPGLSYERDLIQKYYRDKENMGFEFAYQFPGMIRVLQAVGRLIRSSTDRGICLLIDDRFSQSNYRNLMPINWNIETCFSVKQVTDQITKFW